MTKQRKFYISYFKLQMDFSILPILTARRGVSTRLRFAQPRSTPATRYVVSVKIMQK